MERQPTYRRPLITSIVLHVIVFFILAMGFQLTGENIVFENTPNAPQVMNAVIITASPTPAPQPPKPIPQPMKALAAPQPVAKPIPTPPQVVKAPKPVVTPPQQDVIALDVKKQKKLQQEKIEKQLLADLKKQQVDKKKLKQKELEKSFASELKNLSAKSLQQQMKNEINVTADQARQAQGVVDKYKALVLQVVGQHWIIPPNADKNSTVSITIYLAPGGMVLDAEIAKNSGNPELDNSARAAVFKSSPLPVPQDTKEFAFFKKFTVVFKPKYFLQG